MRSQFIIYLALILLATFNQSLFSQSHNSLYFVFLNSNPDKELISEQQVKQLQDAHIKNIKALKNEGRLLAAGPFEGGGGMFILTADDLETAKGYLNTDPAINANRFKIEIYPFNIHNGNLCDPPEKYDMVTYPFIRFVSNINSEEERKRSIYDNRLFLSNLNTESDNIVVYGKFDYQTDGILILKQMDIAAAEEIIKTHPSVMDGTLTYEIRPLWIAKGTFCE